MDKYWFLNQNNTLTAQLKSENERRKFSKKMLDLLEILFKEVLQNFF